MIMDSYFCDKPSDKVIDGDGPYIYGVWISLDRPSIQSSECLQMNQSKFFKELQSIHDEDAPKDIMGVTMTWKVTLKDIPVNECWWFNGTTILRLYANGSYVFDLSEEDGGLEEEQGPGDEDKTQIQHCGVWDYEGNL